MSADASGEPVDPWADPAATALWRDLVAIHPSNLEDPVRGRYEKPRYGPAVDRIESAARSWGLEVRRYDPTHMETGERWRGIPRPNLIVDLEVEATERVLILAHYDVVPVPAEQLGRWASPPRELTRRADGRWYGRGSSDDLGSGVVASLLAMKRLRSADVRRRSVRLLVCCDEETGGEGGIEALKERDAERPHGDPERFLLGDVALIPDGSPHATAASSGVAFLDGTFTGPVALAEALGYGEHLVGLRSDAESHRSRYPSPDFPDHEAPFPVITGRASVTRFDLTSPEIAASRAVLLAAHAETDATNFIPEAVTIAIGGPTEERAKLRIWSTDHLPSGFRLASGGPTALETPIGSELWQIVGAGGHGGSPHRARNPVPVTFELLRGAGAAGLIDLSRTGVTSFGVDLRLVPESPLDHGLEPVLAGIRTWNRANAPTARIDAPPARCRRGYALPLDDPHLQRLAGILSDTLGARGIFGEYGGTDASSLSDVKTPHGRPLPAIVFGSMDRASRIHDAEESADPRLLRGVAESIERFVADA